MLAPGFGHQLGSMLFTTPDESARSTSSAIAPSPTPEPILTEASMVFNQDSNKKCPSCGNEIKAEAKLCRFCKASFDVAARGYCTTCHQVMDADANNCCISCGTVLADIHIESKYVKPGTQAAPPQTQAGFLSTPEQQGDHMTRIKRWCSGQKDRPIKVNVITNFGVREDSITTAHGKLLAIEEHSTRKGIFTARFDSHLHREDEDDHVMLGYEITSVEERGDQLIIYKGSDQRFELIAGVEPEAPPASTNIEWPEIPGYGFHSCFPCGGNGSNGKCESCEGYGKILVREPARRCPTCGGNGYLTEREIYLGPMCPACRGTGWQDALKFSEAIANLK
jgi:hypothetical protein